MAEPARADESTERSSTWRTGVFAALSTALGLGYAPVAPGTAGTLLGVGIHVAVALSLPAGPRLPVLTICFVAACAACVPLANWAETYWGKKDPGRFVLDEVAGYLLVLLLARSGGLTLHVIWAFVLFRIFDIVKPPPARSLEEVRGGWGVLLDDLVAGAYAGLVLNVLAIVVPSWVGATAA